MFSIILCLLDHWINVNNKEYVNKIYRTWENNKQARELKRTVLNIWDTWKYGAFVFYKYYFVVNS